MLEATEPKPISDSLAVLASAPEPEEHGLSLVVADRGFVWVGEAITDGEWVKIKGARVVRRWGTSEGLNQLANQGPLTNTRLDAPADLKVSRRALIAIIPCEASKWAA